MSDPDEYAPRADVRSALLVVAMSRAEPPTKGEEIQSRRLRAVEQSLHRSMHDHRAVHVWRYLMRRWTAARALSLAAEHVSRRAGVGGFTR